MRSVCRTNCASSLEAFWYQELNASKRFFETVFSNKVSGILGYNSLYSHRQKSLPSTQKHSTKLKKFHCQRNKEMQKINVRTIRLTRVKTKDHYSLVADVFGGGFDRVDPNPDFIRKMFF